MPGHRLCLYDRRRMPLEILNGALVTHPIAGLGGEFRDNPFYEPTVTALPEIDNWTARARLASLVPRREAP